MTTLTFTNFGPGIGGTNTQQCCLGSDGNIWACDNASNVWKTTPAGVTTLGGISSVGGVGICQGSDGYMYVTTEAAGSCQLHKISQSTASEVASYFLFYSSAIGPCITGPDGNVWFGIGSPAAMVRFDIGTHVNTQFTVSNNSQQYSDGTYLWSTGDGYFQRVDMSGTITAWYITSDTTTYSITPDGSGNFWLGGANLYRVSPSGTLLATISLPGGASCRGAILGPDGLPWFGDYGNFNLYQVTSSSTFNTYTFRQSGTSPPNTGGTPAYPICGAIGSDGNMWWSSYPTTSVTRVTGVTPTSSGNKIVRLL